MLESTTHVATGNHVIVKEVFGVELTDVVGHEVRVHRVHFVTGDKLIRSRKRLGFPKPLSKYHRRSGELPLASINRNGCYAVFKSRRSFNSSDVDREVKLLRDEFYLFASSFFGRTRCKRSEMSLVGRSQFPRNRDLLIFDSSVPLWRRHLHRELRCQPERVDDLWKGNAEHGHFFALLKILQGKTRPGIHKAWRGTIRRAAVLAGRSHLAVSLADAFLLDMIAIEVLLAQPMEKFPDVLIRRLMALFGWMTDEDPEHWKSQVKHLYDLRCSYVHEGTATDLTGFDLFVADTLLANLLTNVCTLTNHIHRKQDLVQLAGEYQARRTLGLKPKRPGGISFSETCLNDYIMERMSEVERWCQ